MLTFRPILSLIQPKAVVSLSIPRKDNGSLTELSNDDTGESHGRDQSSILSSLECIGIDVSLQDRIDGSNSCICVPAISRARDLRRTHRKRGMHHLRRSYTSARRRLSCGDELTFRYCSDLVSCWWRSHRSRSRMMTLRAWSSSTKGASWWVYLYGWFAPSVVYSLRGNVVLYRSTETM